MPLVSQLLEYAPVGLRVGPWEFVVCDVCISPNTSPQEGRRKPFPSRHNVRLYRPPQALDGQE